MRALDWQKFLQKQRDDHRKVVFTTAELANVAQATPKVLNVTLRRLVQQGILVRYAAGRYGLPGAAQPEDLVPALDASAYVTGHYALYKHGLVTQAPAEITCFTNRRHNRSRVRKTPLGRLVFVCIGLRIYHMPRTGVRASPEQALCDYAHLCRKRGVRPLSLVTPRNMDRVDRRKLKQRLRSYPSSVRRDIEQLLHSMKTQPVESRPYP